MSERTVVETLVPLHHFPQTREERGQVVKAAYDAAAELVKPGRVLGLLTTARSQHALTGAPAMKFRFAVEAPESIQPQRTSFAAS